MKSAIYDLLQLAFPNFCLLCENSLIGGEKTLCMNCKYHLPKYISSKQSQRLNKLFWGRVNVQYVFTYLNFNKGNAAQRLIYLLKYKGEKELGEILGQWLGKSINKISLGERFDCIVPVPLNSRKKKVRGYNQSELFANGLSKALDIPINLMALSRITNSKSQTNKSRFDRWVNVQNDFQVDRPEDLIDKHVLIADDVLTTGATMEAVSNKILSITGTKVSMATIAAANQ